MLPNCFGSRLADRARHYGYPERGWAQLDPDAIALTRKLRFDAETDIVRRRSAITVNLEDHDRPIGRAEFLTRDRQTNPVS